MITIRLTFAAGRYHATPWGRHVNEGVAEWPPSPYRLLRALYDVWQRKCFDLPEEDVRAVLERLASSPPEFKLPSAVATHTRSYLSANAKDPSEKNLVFDPFLAFNRPHALYACWPEADLSARERRTLCALLRNLNYLGRSESWVEACLWEGPATGEFEARASEAAGEGEELRPLACAAPSGKYKGKQPWIEALTFSTANLIKERVSSPPLLRQVRYTVPANAVMVDPPRRVVRRSSEVEAVVLSLDSTVLPLATTTIEVAEQIRSRLMGAYKARMGEANMSPLFSGKREDGQKRLDHGHVYILPQFNSVGRIDRVLIINPLGVFSEDELNAVRGVRELWQRDGRPAVRCVLTWQGKRNDPAQRRMDVSAVSMTPFVPPRHWRKGRDFRKFIVEEARRECRNHGIEGALVDCELLGRLSGLFDIVEYRRNRKGDPVRPGYALRLTFDRPVAAPFAIGYGAHFGLGQFMVE